MSREPVHQPTPAGQVPPIVCPGTIRPRDPASFSGLDDRDVEDWLSTFERISTHNKWDDAMKLNNVGFSFTHLAELWFNNHRREMSTWAEFKERFMKAFGRPEVRKLQAEQRLRVRAQKTGEYFMSYIEDVVDLCKRVDPSMLETEKVKHILKGIDDDAFQMLLSKDPRTVSDVIRLCQSYDELRKQRAFTRRPLGQNEPLASLAVDLDDQSVSCTSLPESYATSKEAVPTKAVPSHVGLNGNEEAESQSKQPPLRQKSVATMPPLRPIGNHGTVLPLCCQGRAAATWP
ncbi:uncharacterized protein LOC144142936 [Haemaphysalis longicornis]